MKPRKESALNLIENGIHVVPLHNPIGDDRCSCGNDCGSIGKHPRISDWPNQASCDSDQIKEWWNQWPNSNIGIVCGEISNLVVLDVDPRHDGDRSLCELEDKVGRFTQTTAVSTGGGSHFYFRYPGTNLLKNSTGELGDGLDIKTDGGLIVAPGSLHQSGAFYEWIRGLDQLKSFPKELISYLNNNPPSGNIKPATTSLSSVESIPEGRRNDTLFMLGVRLRKKGSDYPQMYNELLDINAKRCNPPLKDSEVEQIAKSASKPPASDSMKSEIKEKEYGLWNTDFGNAREFVDKYGDRIRYDIDDEEWLYWDGIKWRRDPTGLYVMGMAKRLIESLYERAQDIDHQEKANRKQKHARKSANEARLKAMMSLATTFPNIKVSKDDLDQDPMLITLDNLTIDMRNWKKLKLNPDHLITKQLPFAFDGDARCPKWKNFISQIMDRDQDMINFLQQAIGYSLTGLTIEQCLFFLYGDGRNGKSTFVEVLMHLLGDYSIKSDSKMIMNRSYSSGVPNDLARLCGNRLVVLSEIQEGKRLDEAKLKNLTGSDTVTARFLRKEFFDFKPTHKLWVFGNHKPLINGTDEGIWRRMRLIEFGVTIPKEQVDPQLKQKLLKELPGIFNWAIQGLIDWKENGKQLDVPASIRKDTLAYRSEMDLLQKFLDERCNREATASCSNQLLRKEYQDWCSECDIPPMSSRRMSPKLEQRGFKKYKSNGRVHWKGVAPK